MSYFQTLTDAARDACHAEGVEFRDVPADGRWHRADVADDPHGKGDASIKLFADGEGGMVFNWKGSGKPVFFWTRQATELNPTELEARRKRQDTERQAAKREQERQWAESGDKARADWQSYSPARPNLPQLAGKGILDAYGCKVTPDGRLATPVYGPDDQIQAIQYRHTDGQKRNHPGCKMEGGFFWIGTPNKDLPILVATSFSTAASLYQTMGEGHRVYISYGDGNLEAVGRMVQTRHGGRRILLCGDDDVDKPGNPGRTKAEAASRALGLPVWFPDFGPDRPKGATDGNDLYQLAGPDEVRRQIAAALEQTSQNFDQTSHQTSQAETFAISQTSQTSQTSQAFDEIELTDPNIPPPKPDPVMFYGLVGDVGRIAATDTEVNPVAASVAFLSFLGANVGRDVYLPVGNTYHHARLFTLHVGRSGRGRKGDAKSLVERIQRRLNEVYSGVLGGYHGGGLSSREGLVMLIHDGYTQGKKEIPPIDDKRLLIVESEFANVLHQGKRDGNTLSAALRDGWDGVSIKPATKAFAVWASDPHIGIHACITPSELLSLIQSRDLSNGFANRFLTIWAEKTRNVAFPLPTPKEVLNDLVDRTQQVIRFAKGEYPAKSDSRRMHFNDEARMFYQEIYLAELTKPQASDLLTTLLERQAPYVIRLAMLFALCDLSLEITRNHLVAALAWVRYWRDSVRFIFSTAVNTAEAEEKTDTARKILAFLKAKPEGMADKTTIIVDCFQRHVSAKALGAALRDMLIATPPRIELVEIPRQDARKGGRKRKVYRLTEPSANFANFAKFGSTQGDESANFDAKFAPESAKFAQTPMGTDGDESQIVEGEL